ncbi:MAG: hypothetical protein H8F28_21540 [Fibrella sp.]|nr:hypothetical protein [Armatimonadota bacterium]
MKTNSRIRLNLSAKTAYTFFGVIVAGIVLGGGVSLRTRAALSTSAPASTQVASSAHPATPSVSTWKAPLPNGPRPQAPISLAFETSDGNALYTRRVNQITSRAVQGGREWLGTHLGVKVIDSQTNRVRHYTRRDGLPGDYVEDIVVDAGGVFCVVRVGTGAGRIALCLLDPANGKWRTLQEARPLLLWNNGNDGWREGGNWQRLRGRSRLALNPHVLLFAPSTVGRESDAVLYVFDRAAKTVRPVTWDPSVRADNPVLGASFLGLNGTHLFLGTNIGLFTIPLPSGKEDADTEAVWQRSLADRFVDCGVLSPDGKTLWLAVHDRIPKSPPSQGQSDSGDNPKWNLVALDTKTRRLTTAAPLSGTAQTFSEAITLDTAGNVWLIPQAASDSRRLPYLGKDAAPVLVTDRFDRYTPATNRWTHLTFSGDDMSAEVAPSSLARQGYTPFAPPPAPASKDRIPDAAVIELALDRATDDSVLTGNGIAYINDDSYSSLRRPDAWVRSRFPQWYCPAERELIHTTYGLARDPAKPGWVWSHVGRTLVHCPEAGYSSPADAVRYTFEGGSSLLVRPRVEAILAPGGDSNRVIVHTASGVFELREDSSDWKPLYRPDDDGIFDALNNPMVRVGTDGRTILFRPSGNKQPLQYLDLGAGRFTESMILAPPNSTLIAGGTKGAWFRNGQRKIAYFVPLGADAHSAGPVEPVDPVTTFPAQLAPPAANRFFMITGATGDIVWFTAHLRRRPTDRSRNSDTHTQSVIGYDRARHRWTMPLELDPAFGSSYVPFLGSDGAAYIPYDTLSSAVFRYDGTTDGWGKFAAPLPKMAELGDKRSRSALTLIAAGGKQETCLTDWKYLYRYDNEREKWSHEPLPQPLQGNNNPFTLQWRTATTKGSYWIGSEQGLWCYDPAKRTWQERELSQALASASEAEAGGGKAGSGDNTTDVFLYPRAVDSRSVWGTLVPRRGEHGAIFRFDRATKSFILYNQRNGVPVKEFGSLMSDGDGLWVFNQNGSYRLDPRTGKTTMMFRRQYSEDAPADEEARQAIPVGSVIAVQEDPVDANAAYVLLNSAGETLYPNDAQPAILYRVDRRSGKLTPLPIPPAVLTALKERNTGEPYFTRAPSITGSGGLLAQRGSNGTELWVGTTAGVFRIDPATNIWRLAELPPGVPRFNGWLIGPAPGGGRIWIQSYSGDILQLPKSAATAPPQTTIQHKVGAVRHPQGSRQKNNTGIRNE